MNTMPGLSSSLMLVYLTQGGTKKQQEKRMRLYVTKFSPTGFSASKEFQRNSFFHSNETTACVVLLIRKKKKRKIMEEN